MGAALRSDPFMIRKAEFWKVQGDPLARAIRKKFRHQNIKPARKFLCVYSEEKPKANLGQDHSCGTSDCICNNTKWNSSKAQINGSLCHITSIFGMSIAGIVVNTVIGE